MSLYTAIRHPRAHAGRDHEPEWAGDRPGFSERLAAWITARIGSMWTAYICLAVTVAENGSRCVAAVRMFYPDWDIEVESVELEDPEQIGGLDRFAVLARPGEVLRLPPRGFLSRLAAAVVTGRDHDECAARTRRAQEHLVVRGRRV